MILPWLLGMQVSAGAPPADACSSSWRMERLPPPVAAIENAHAWMAGGRVFVTGLVNGAVVVMDASGKSLGFPKAVRAAKPVDPRVVVVSGTTHVLWGEGDPEVHTVWISSKSGARAW